MSRRNRRRHARARRAARRVTLLTFERLVVRNGRHVRLGAFFVLRYESGFTDYEATRVRNAEGRRLWLCTLPAGAHWGTAYRREMRRIP